MPAAPEDPTVTFPARPGEPTRTFAAGAPPAAGFDEELRRLLRSRLILVHLLGAAQNALLQTMNVLTPEDPNLRARIPIGFVVGFAECLIGAVALWLMPRVSLRALRLWELIHFGLQAAAIGLFRFGALAGVGEETPVLAVGFWGAVSMFGIVALILAYGVLIPNTTWRSLTGVLCLTAVPFAALAVAAAVNPALRAGGHVAPLAFQAAYVLVLPAAIAVFAAARAAALQRRAFEAERRAEQVGQYVLKRKLGEGGMGEVYLAEHRLLKRPCAVKFVRPELAASPGAAARFEREVRAVTGLSHVNTVRVYDYGRADDGSFYCVMEYLDGPTLERLVRDVGPLPPGRVVYLLRQLCGALAEAHAAGLVHRDLKPGNVIVARLGGVCDVAKLLDFGLVLDESAADGDGRLTRAGAVLGTPAYMPPEQAGGEAVDARGDVYGLGAVGYFALTGRAPFDGKAARQVLTAVLTQPAPPLAGAPADLAAVITRCLAKDPADRFPTARDLDRALAGCACAADWSAERAAADER